MDFGIVVSKLGKFLEDDALMVRRHPDAGIVNRHAQHLIMATATNQYFPGMGKAQRVCDKIPQDLLHQLRIALNPRVAGYDTKIESLCLCRTCVFEFDA